MGVESTVGVEGWRQLLQFFKFSVYVFMAADAALQGGPGQSGHQHKPTSLHANNTPARYLKMQFVNVIILACSFNV